MDPVSPNNKGFSLVEFLVALVILMVGMLGLLQAINVSMNANIQNQLRNEAVTVGDRRLSDELAKGFNGVSTTIRVYPINTRQVQLALKNYSVTRSGVSFQNSKEVRFQVTWNYRGVRYTHNTGGVISNANQ